MCLKMSQSPDCAQIIVCFKSHGPTAIRRDRLDWLSGAWPGMLCLIKPLCLLFLGNYVSPPAAIGSSCVTFPSGSLPVPNSPLLLGPDHMEPLQSGSGGGFAHWLHAAAMVSSPAGGNADLIFSFQE